MLMNHIQSFCNYLQNILVLAFYMHVLHNALHDGTYFTESGVKKFTRKIEWA